MSHTSTPVTDPMSNGATPGKASPGHSAVEPTRPITPVNATNCYRAVAPDGRQITIPQELFAVFSDFIKTKKCPGSVTIDFRCDEIIGMETLTKKRFPGKI